MKVNYQKFYFILFACLTLLLGQYNESFAAHIIGGEITYECLGTNPAGTSNTYRITMRIFRDCQGGGADFDSNPGTPFEATVSIYQDGSTLPRIFYLDAPEVSRIEPTSDPCFSIPENICVEEGIYVFETDLPIVDDTYHIVYQRCCRNSTITNITSPSLTGATYTTELTAEAQRVCNSSPAFENSLPIVVCIDQPLSFDLSGTDAEGDSLVYEFCTPLLGGGPDTDFPETADGVAPNPDNPPPYESVEFIQPTYSATNPLGNIANAQIDRSTGLFTASPKMFGQFVIAVCMYEYRDGELLSLTHRDFQINVTNCTPKVIAQIAADSVVLADDAFFLKACGIEGVELTNESVERDNILSFFWEFNIQGETQRYDSWDLSLDFPAAGEYSGQLILNPNTSCGDTANIFISARPNVNADFAIDYDTCFGGTVQFEDLSSAESMQLTDWRWDFGDGTESSLQNPTHDYQSLNEFQVRLQVTDINDCTDEIIKPLPYFPIPMALEVQPSIFQVCAPDTVQFTNLSEPLDDRYLVEWDFGDGGTSNAINPTYVYESPGNFDVSLSVTAPTGCRVFAEFDDLIFAQLRPKADFSFTPAQPDLRNSTLTIFNTSEDADAYEWLLNGSFESVLENPIISLLDTGFQSIELIALNENGCTDTLIQFVDIAPEVFAYLPNAFSPNDDGENDGFQILGLLGEVRAYEMQIWDRWGNLIFETTDINRPWRGNTLSNVAASIGVYVYTISFLGPRDKSYQYSGSVTLMR